MCDITPLGVLVQDPGTSKRGLLVETILCGTSELDPFPLLFCHSTRFIYLLLTPWTLVPPGRTEHKTLTKIFKTTEAIVKVHGTKSSLDPLPSLH